MCILRSIGSFLHEASYPSTSTEMLRERCKVHTNAIRCLRDKNKSTTGLLRRGVSGMQTGAQRWNKKYCTNVDSGVSKQLVRDNACIIEKKDKQARALELNMASQFQTILERNYNDSAIELKLFCCTLLTHRKNLIDLVSEKDCGASAKRTMTEFAQLAVPQESNILCDDDMLQKVCPKVEEVKPTRILNKDELKQSAANGLYLVLTLGEPERA